MENNKNLWLYIGTGAVILVIVVGAIAYSVGKRHGQTTTSPVATNTTTETDGSVLGESTATSATSTSMSTRFVDTSYNLNKESHTGYITDLTEQDGVRYVSIQYVSDFGKCPIGTTPSECVNGVKVVKNSDLVHTFSIVGNAHITTQTFHTPFGTSSEELMTVPAFMSLFNSDPRVQAVPFVITIQDGVIISLAEEYFPQ